MPHMMQATAPSGITPLQILSLAQRLELSVAVPRNGEHFAVGRYGGAGLFLTHDGDRVRRALASSDSDGVLAVMEVAPGLAAIVAKGTPDWLTAKEPEDVPVIPEGLQEAPPVVNWNTMNLYDYLGEITLGDQFEVVGDSGDFEPAWEAMKAPDSLPEVWRSPDGRVSVHWLDHDDNRDVCAFMDGKPAGVYVRGMSFVHEEFRRNRIGMAMVVLGSMISNRQPALEPDGEEAGMIGYSEQGFLLHEAAFAILQSPDPMLALATPRPDYMPDVDQPRPETVPVRLSKQMATAVESFRAPSPGL